MTAANALMVLAGIGTLSLELRAAEQATAAAKRAYYDAWRSFECGGEPELCGREECRIQRGDPAWDEAQQATAMEFNAYKAAQRAAYNVNRRWQNACRKATQ